MSGRSRVPGFSVPSSFFAAMDLRLTFLLVQVLAELIARHKRNIFCIIYSYDYFLLSIVSDALPGQAFIGDSVVRQRLCFSLVIA